MCGRDSRHTGLIIALGGLSRSQKGHSIQASLTGGRAS